MHRLSDDVVTTEGKGEVADTAADFGPGTGRLDLTGGLDEVDRVFGVLLKSRGHREDVRVEDDVLARNSDPRQQLVGTLTDRDLALRRVGLAILIKRHHHERRTVPASNPSLGEERLLPFLHADRVDDGLALAALESRLNRRKPR